MLNKIIHGLLRHRYLKSMPRDPQASDLYLVEFPKSGVTWLSTILANAALVHSGMSQRASFYNISQYIPDIYLSNRHIGGRSYTTPLFRMLKSHAEYNPYYSHVIYLVRHPVSVMTSYYTFLSQHGVPFKNVNAFLEDHIYGLPAWKRHVNSWLTSDNQAARLHLVRYEDLLSDVFGEIVDINENLGLGFDSLTLNEAALLSDVVNMKKSEDLYSKRNPRYRLSFVKGERMKFPSEVIGEINIKCANELKLLGYLDSCSE